MQQIRIAIVEDETLHAELLEKHIESWKQQRDTAARVQRFCHAQAFFFAWEEETYDMIFLDIQMPGIDGMETARKIREKDDKVRLVFTTGISDYLQEGYEVEALRYLLKPIARDKVWECLDKLLQEPREAPQLLFHTEEGVVKLQEQDIEYFEARGHYTICRLQPGKRVSGQIGGSAEELQLRESFSGICDRLAQRPFIRCHRSYLCHIVHIHRVEKTELLLESGNRIPVSRRMYETVVKAFIAYFRRE